MRIIISAVLQEHDTHRDRGRFSQFFDLHGAGRGHRVIVGAPADERLIVATILRSLVLNLKCTNLPVLLIGLGY